MENRPQKGQRQQGEGKIAGERLADPNMLLPPIAEIFHRPRKGRPGHARQRQHREIERRCVHRLDVYEISTSR